MKPVDLLMLASRFANATSQWLPTGKCILFGLTEDERDFVVAALKLLDEEVRKSAP